MALEHWFTRHLQADQFFQMWSKKLVRLKMSCEKCFSFLATFPNLLKLQDHVVYMLVNTLQKEKFKFSRIRFFTFLGRNPTLINLCQLHWKDQKTSNLFVALGLQNGLWHLFMKTTSNFRFQRKYINQLHNYHLHKKPIHDEHLT